MFVIRYDPSATVAIILRRMFLSSFNIYFNLISIPVFDLLFQYRFMFLSFCPSLLVLLISPLLSNSLAQP
ncbi:hypothetical protein Hdeb2414_s0016g00477571 [Helianthus debilis subsp. tardiflorus]